MTNRFGIHENNLIKNDPEYNADDFIGYHSHGAEAVNSVIQQLNQQGIDVYFVPRFPVSTVYEDFGFDSLHKNSEFRLRTITNVKENTTEKPKDPTILLYDVEYNPAVYPPPEDYYMQINLKMVNQRDMVGHGDGFYTTIFYGMYTWFNEFDWERNLWARPLGIYIDENKNWKIHPGRARTSFVQFLQTDTPLMLFVHRSIDMKEYMDTAIKITDIDSVRNTMLETSGFDDIEFYIRNYDYIADGWYTNRIHGQAFTGEIFRTYFGEKLVVEFKNDVILFNNEPVAHVKNGLIYFTRATPKFSI